MRRTRAKVNSREPNQGLSKWQEGGKKGVFGAAMKGAREEMAKRDYGVSLRGAALAAGIPKATYGIYENGQGRPPRAILLALSVVFGSSDRIIRDLNEAYDVEFGPDKCRPVEEAFWAKELFRIDEFVHLATRDIFRTYESDDIHEADAMARTYWRLALLHAPTSYETQRLATVCARVASQAGRHYDALDILDHARKYTDFGLEPIISFEQEVSRVAIINRIVSPKGVSAALSYEEPLRTIEDRSGLNDLGANPRWWWQLHNAQRSRIIALTDSLSTKAPDDLWPVKRAFADNARYAQTDNDHRSIKLVQARITAIQHPGEALEALKVLRSKADSFGEKALIARSISIAYFRNGQVEQAIECLNPWIQDTADRGMVFKLDQFRSLQLVMTRFQHHVALGIRPGAH